MSYSVTTPWGEQVVEGTRSHIHAQVTPELFREAVGKLPTPKSDETFLKVEVGLGRVIGRSHCVRITPRDILYYAQREKREGLTQFVQGRQPEETEYLSMILNWSRKDHVWIIVSAFVGQLAEKEPWDRNIGSEEEHKKCVEFWETHALTQGSEPEIPGTRTNKRPW